MAIMNKRVEKRVNQRILQKKKPIGLDDFLLIIRLEWDNIDKSILSNLFSGVKKRLEAVIEKGGLTIDH